MTVSMAVPTSPSAPASIIRTVHSPATMVLTQGHLQSRPRAISAPTRWDVQEPVKRAKMDASVVAQRNVEAGVKVTALTMSSSYTCRFLGW